MVEFTINNHFKSFNCIFTFDVDTRSTGELLSNEEKAWLNAYHAQVIKIIGPKLDSRTKAWLEQRARAL